MAAQRQCKQKGLGKANRFESFSDDSQDEDSEDATPVSGRVNMVYADAVLRGMNASASKSLKSSTPSITVSAGAVGTSKVSQSDWLFG